MNARPSARHEFTTLDGTLDAAWAAFGRGDGAAPTVVVASVREGRAEARMMVLRGADREAARLEVQSDAAAGKIGDLRAASGATVLLWDAALDFQVRARVRATVLTGSDAAGTWAGVPEAAKARYGGTPPGAALSRPEDVGAGPDPSRFAVIRMAVEEIETLVLGAPHRRALFRAADGFAGRWIAP